MGRYLVAFSLVLGLSGLGTPMLAQTPDAETPAVESACDDLTGAAFGLCNAYCEAQDCDEFDGPSCERLRDNFEEHTGSRAFPCDIFVGCTCEFIAESNPHLADCVDNPDSRLCGGGSPEQTCCTCVLSDGSCREVQYVNDAKGFCRPNSATRCD